MFDFAPHSEEEDSDDDENYAAGVDEYLEEVEKRRTLRESNHLELVVEIPARRSGVEMMLIISLS